MRDEISGEEILAKIYEEVGRTRFNEKNTHIYVGSNYGRNIPFEIVSV